MKFFSYFVLFHLLILLIIFIYSYFFIGKPIEPLTVSENDSIQQELEDDAKKLGLTDQKAHFIPPKIYPNFISEFEAKYIIKNASNHFEESTIVSGTNLSIRKSQTSTLNNKDPILKPIIERICDIVGYPFENVEPVQVVKYGSDGYYNEHYDSCPDKNDYCRRFVENGGQRVVTMVLYLNDEFTGGTTKFVNLEKEYKPAKYGGVLFYSMDAAKTKTHPLSLHAGTPLTSGTKYIANIWIRENKYS